MKNKGGRPKVIEDNLLRNRRICCRLTDNEYKKIINKIPKNMSISDGIRALLLSDKTNIFHMIDFNKYLFEINKIGVNLNQISKKINLFGEINEEDIYHIKREIIKINAHFEHVLLEINKNNRKV